ncbi:MAG: molybdopterin-guanine dinucleotide biosynthesis protein B [candidate division Zixibacteria bacterium]|nr:molybdopterin-guanine dinucleotide biosynthesis protein B [candidate division Zixibacteria bacterium]
MPRILHIVGCKNAGKTRACELLIEPLHRQGLAVGTLKFTDHDGFDWDQPGKDTFRHREAGSAVTGIFGLHTYAFRFHTDERPAVTLDSLVSTFYAAMDLVLVEGYRQGSGPMLEVCRPGYSNRAVMPSDKLLAIYGADMFPRGVPHFDYGAEDSLAAFIAGNLDRLHEPPQA